MKFSRSLALVACMLLGVSAMLAQVTNSQGTDTVQHQSSHVQSIGYVEAPSLPQKQASKSHQSAVAPSAATGKAKGHGYVDLGLSVKWATCNVGAKSPTGYGDYFAWGETSPKASYADENSVTYGKTLGNIAGNASYDAARANWGGAWRLPTMAEFAELVADCTTEWKTIDGVKGLLFTSKRNGRAIFLPAADLRSSYPLSFEDAGGCYWSSTPKAGDEYDACDLGFGRGYCSIYKAERYLGMSVRPVLK